jgi:enolase
MKIKDLKAIEIIDSRGNPTLKVECTLESGFIGVASVPSGASTGLYEAYELRDGDTERFNGLGVLKAVLNVNDVILNNVKGIDFEQETLDEKLIILDGTENKSKLGANAILGTSISFLKASAKEKNLKLYEYIQKISGSEKLSLPNPAFNIINGGKHADSGLDVQEFMIIPINFLNIKEKIRVASEITKKLKKLLLEKNYTVSVGDEGGFAPHLSSNEEALEFICEAIKISGYSLNDVKIGLDVAASSFFKNGLYNFKNSNKLNNTDIIKWYEKLIEKYPIISIEDGLEENDFTGFSLMKELLGNKINIVGDDLTVTNIKRIEEAVKFNSINSVLIKPNQIGTVSETLKAVYKTKENGWKPFISHRSGETEDTFISDLSVGTNSDFIKSGAPQRGERVSKYNRLMEIENEIL